MAIKVSLKYFDKKISGMNVQTARKRICYGSHLKKENGYSTAKN
jgi:hypothetical protein